MKRSIPRGETLPPVDVETQPKRTLSVGYASRRVCRSGILAASARSSRGADAGDVGAYCGKARTWSCARRRPSPMKSPMHNQCGVQEIFNVGARRRLPPQPRQRSPTESGCTLAPATPL
ncbi:hypothetical protein KCP73_22640 [Salmonella enterica subsp. enterica]|nr:hypothetical protein KCP73_22640 [Salmonella enterica subsp. enterica]